MKAWISFYKRTLYSVLFLLAIGSSTHATEVDSTLTQAYYPYSYSSMTSNGNNSSKLSLVEIESEDLDDDKQFEVRPNICYAINLGGEGLTQENLAKLKGFSPFVFKLSLFNAYLDNDLLESLPIFPHGAILDISNNYYDDKGMGHLVAKFPNLVALTISTNKITSEAGLFFLQLSKLLYLDAGCTFLGSEGVKLISQSTTIEHLNLRACGLDDSVFPYISSMCSLKWVVLSNNKFSLYAKEMFIRNKKLELQASF